MRGLLVLATLVFLTTASFPSAAAEPGVTFFSVRDASGDVTGDLPDRSQGFVNRPGLDVVRFGIDTRGDSVIVRYDTAGAPETKGSEVVLNAYYASEAPHEFGIHFTWDEDGEPSTRLGTLQDGDRSEVFEPVAQVGDGGVTLSFPRALLPPTIECLTGTLYVKNGGFDHAIDEATPTVDTCYGESIRTDGLGGDCPAATLPAGVSADWSFTDPSGDVEKVTVDWSTGQESREKADASMPDVVAFTSRLDGGRVTQSVTFAQDLPVDDGYTARVVNALAGGGRFLVWEYTANGPDTGMVADAVEGALTPNADELAEGTSVLVIGDRPDARTLRVEFCASLVPADAACFAPHAKATHALSFSETVEDGVTPSPDACKGKPAFASAGTDEDAYPADDSGYEDDYGDEGDEEYGDEHDPDAGTVSGDDAGTKGTPAPGVLALVGALAVAVLVAGNASVRRR